MAFIQTKQWEYKCETYSESNWSECESLNYLGLEGWELVNVIVYDGMIFCYLKREKQ